MKLSSAMLACLLLGSPAATLADLKVEPDERNIVASRLEGKWRLERALTKRITGEEPKGVDALIVRNDPAALEKLSPNSRNRSKGGKSVCMRPDT